MGVAGIAGAIAKNRAANNAARQQNNRIASANQLAGTEYDQNMAAFNQALGSLPGGVGGFMNAAMAPQVTTQSQSYNQQTDTSGTQGLVKTPELLATRTRAAQAAAEVPYSLAGMVENQFRNIAAGERAGQTAEQNLAASRGIDPSLARAAFAVGPSQQAANNARLNALQAANETAYGRATAARGEQASIEQMLADQFQNQTSRTSGSSRGTTTGPANFGAALGLLGAQQNRPQRQIFV